MKKSISPYGVAAFAAYLLTQPLSMAYAEDTQAFKDDLVKAGFVYNFVKFVAWPGDRAITKSTNIDVCVIGDSPMNNTGHIFKTASTERLKMNLVNEPSWRNAIKHCHIVVISDDQAGKLPEMMLGFKKEPVLTVSEIENFAQSGGIMQFVTEDNKIQLIVNLKAAKEAGLSIDAQLLEIAKQVLNK